jgi:hypothetical protein
MFICSASFSGGKNRNQLLPISFSQTKDFQSENNVVPGQTTAYVYNTGTENFNHLFIAHSL